jgi:hypothetical protein
MDFNCLDRLYGPIIFTFFIVPLAVWKLVDIVVWITTHLSISWN